MKRGFLILLALFGGAPKVYAGGSCATRIAFVGNPWSSGRDLVLELERRGIVTHGIQVGEVPEWAHDSLYLERGRSLLIHDGNLDKLEAQAAAFKPDAFLYGADGDVLEVVDDMAERFRLRGNGTRYTRERHTKNGLQELLGKAGRNHLKGVLARDLPQAVDFVSKVGGYNVFIKPNNDGGGTLTFLINNEGELKEKLELILRSINTTTGLRNKVALVQEVADGIEFAAQGVVRDEEHKFSSVLQYEKVGVDTNTETYQSEWILEPESSEAQMVMAFVADANGIVGFRNGPFHWEVKISKRKNGVVAIELNPRLMGGGMLPWLKDCVGYNDAELTVEAFFFPAEFHRRPRVYRLQNRGFSYEIVTPEEGLELDVRTLHAISQIPGFKRTRLLKPDGGPLPKTINLDTLGGSIDFAHPSEAVVKEAEQKLIEINARRGFFLKK